MNNQFTAAIVFLSFAIIPAFAYSADNTFILAPPILTGKNIESPSSTVEAPPIPSNLCPAVPTLCPDINGEFPPGGSAVTCPANCKAERVVVENPHDASLNGFVPDALEVKPAVCPVGYFAGQQFNMGPDYIYRELKTVSPVSDAAWNAGLSSSGVCSATGKSSSTGTGQAPCNYGSPCGQEATLNTTPGPGTLRCAPSAGTFVVQLTEARYSWTNCGGSCAPGCLRGTWLSTDNYNYAWNEMACTAEAGFYKTGRSVNTSLVCVRSKTEWKALEK